MPYMVVILFGIDAIVMPQKMSILELHEYCKGFILHQIHALANQSFVWQDSGE